MVNVYIYTRVSTSMQVEGYSLEAQKSKVKQYAILHDYEIVGEYVDAGISGKSIEGRIEFNQMIEDIKSGKDDVSFILVYKLSRFGRNAADILNTLQLIEDYGVNLICVEDNIDSSKGVGKLMISILSAVAEIERENISIQTMEGRMQKAREGKWNGGMAPYGYKLVNGKLEINESEAKQVRLIFDKYVNTNLGANGVSDYLYNHGIYKEKRGTGTLSYFTADTIKGIISNPIYKGYISYGRRKKEKIKGTRNKYHQVKKNDYQINKGIHEAIISEGIWDKAQKKKNELKNKYERINKNNKGVHLLTGLLKCPICGANMYSVRSRKLKKDGTINKDFNYYSCKHRKEISKGKKCNYKSQVNEEELNKAVEELIIKMIKDDSLSNLIKEKINIEVDTNQIDLEIERYKKELRINNKKKNNLITELESLNVDDKHYSRMKADYTLRLNKIYDNIEKLEINIQEAKDKKINIEKSKISANNIYDLLTNFEKLYEKLDGYERKELLNTLVSEINIFEEKKDNGQWLKSIKFKLPLIEDIEFGLDNIEQDETVALMSRVKV